MFLLVLHHKLRGSVLVCCSYVRCLDFGVFVPLRKMSCVTLDAFTLHCELAVHSRGVLMYNCVLSIDRCEIQYYDSCTL